MSRPSLVCHGGAAGIAAHFRSRLEGGSSLVCHGGAAGTADQFRSSFVGVALLNFLRIQF